MVPRFLNVTVQLQYLVQNSSLSLSSSSKSFLPGFYEVASRDAPLVLAILYQCGSEERFVLLQDSEGVVLPDET
jgi:hypothetical protein